MCGPFCLHLGQGQKYRVAAGRQLLWHAGRIGTYVFLGALAGHLGRWIGSLGNWAKLQDILAYVAGAVMILAGLSLLGLLPMPWRKPAGNAQPQTAPLLSRLLAPLFVAPTAGSALALGLVTGFLPCPVVLGFLALAAGSGSAASGMAVMGVMGLGTMWSLLLVGTVGQMLRLRLRRWAPAVGGIVIILLGSATVLRGTEVYHRMLGCPDASESASATPAGHPCCPACQGKAETNH
jgi:hypothetical protein